MTATEKRWAWLLNQRKKINREGGWNYGTQISLTANQDVKKIFCENTQFLEKYKNTYTLALQFFILNWLEKSDAPSLSS